MSTLRSACPPVMCRPCGAKRAPTGPRGKWVTANCPAMRGPLPGVVPIVKSAASFPTPGVSCATGAIAIVHSASAAPLRTIDASPVLAIAPPPGTATIASWASARNVPRARVISTRGRRTVARDGQSATTLSTCIVVSPFGVRTISRRSPRKLTLLAPGSRELRQNASRCPSRTSIVGPCAAGSPAGALVASRGCAPLRLSMRSSPRPMARYRNTGLVAMTRFTCGAKIEPPRSISSRAMRASGMLSKGGALARTTSRASRRSR